MQNQAEEQTLISIKYAYFLKGGEKDPSKPNRYYFNFSQEWCTANRGESLLMLKIYLTTSYISNILKSNIIK